MTSLGVKNISDSDYKLGLEVLAPWATYNAGSQITLSQPISVNDILIVRWGSSGLYQQVCAVGGFGVDEPAYFMTNGGECALNFDENNKITVKSHSALAVRMILRAIIVPK